jgi:hypothetical protein
MDGRNDSFQQCRSILDLLRVERERGVPCSIANGIGAVVMGGVSSRRTQQPLTLTHIWLARTSPSSKEEFKSAVLVTLFSEKKFKKKKESFPCVQ